MNEKEKAHLVALGKVTHNFSVLDYALKLFIWGLLRSDDECIGHCITAELPFRGLIDLASSLHKIREINPDIRTKVDAVLVRAQEAEQKRNTIAHSTWGFTEVGDVTTLKSAAKRKKGLGWDFHAMPSSDIEQIATFIRDVANDMHRICQEKRFLENPSRLKIH